MGLIALIQEILQLPAQLNAILARIDSLEASYAQMKKQETLASIDQAQKDTNEAQTSEDLRKVAAENAANLAKL